MSIVAKIVQFACCFILLVDIAVAASTQDTESGFTYLLQEGDVVEISVWKEEGLARESIIAPDGSIAFPLVGQITAKGLTIAQLQQSIATGIGKYIPQPSVTVILLNAKGSKFYVIGKVNRPGEFPITGPVTVLQALSIAGGTTTFAEYNDIQIIRNENGQDSAIPFRYGDIEDGEKLGQNIFLKSGDVVVVP